MRRGLMWTVLAIGLGLVAAPIVFQMFTRAPGGARMLADFEPYMDPEVLAGFRAQLDQADAAVGELDARLPALAASQLGLASDATAKQFSSVDALVMAWPGIADDMFGMLDTIEDNLDNYAAVDALPSFRLFPWFFVLPGLMAAALAATALRRDALTTGIRNATVALGVGLIAAPLVFQMFTRAPLGGQMIDDFQPLMATERITTIQGYFLTMGAGEGQLRTQLVPSLREAGMTERQLARQLPETTAFVDVWPRMSADMAPMMGAMSDNVANFQGIAALPPFPLFPWFFVLPGVLIAGLALAAGRKRDVESSAVARPARRPEPSPDRQETTA